MRVWRPRAYYQLYYHPNRAVLAVVGAVEPERDLAIIERYFGAVPMGPNLLRDIPQEPEQSAERRSTVYYDAEPQMLMGFHKPTYPERDAYVLDMIDSLLSNGRTSRLYKRLVIDEKMALDVFTSAAYPAVREANLFVLYGLPLFPNRNEDLERVMLEELEKLQTEPVSDNELQKVKNQVRAAFIRDLGSGSGLAAQVAFYELFLGGWEKMLDYEATVSSVTAEEVMEVAQRYFTTENRTVAYLLPKSEEPTTNDATDDSSDTAETAEEGQ
ncbi:MAG: pitrilysin family protein [Deinococcales bacterium]